MTPGVLLGVAPFVLAPFAAVAALRPLAIKAAAAREAAAAAKKAEEAAAQSKLQPFKPSNTLKAVLALGAAAIAGIFLQPAEMPELALPSAAPGAAPAIAKEKRARAAVVAHKVAGLLKNRAQEPSFFLTNQID